MSDADSLAMRNSAGTIKAESGGLLLCTGKQQNLQFGVKNKGKIFTPVFEVIIAD